MNIKVLNVLVFFMFIRRKNIKPIFTVKSVGTGRVSSNAKQKFCDDRMKRADRIAPRSVVCSSVRCHSLRAHVRTRVSKCVCVIDTQTVEHMRSAVIPPSLISHEQAG